MRLECPGYFSRNKILYTFLYTRSSPFSPSAEKIVGGYSNSDTFSYYGVSGWFSANELAFEYKPPEQNGASKTRRAFEDFHAKIMSNVSYLHQSFFDANESKHKAAFHVEFSAEAPQSDSPFLKTHHLS